ncbi:MAG: efflux RND transporter periplasmic adaptor subunit, partial [Polynucleobacter victoriensis]
QTLSAYKSAKAAMAMAKKALDDTVIRAPVDGVVVKRSVERGQTVAASLQAPELFIIAQDLSDMQVETAIDESDVGRITEGMTASFTVDAFPGRVFQSKVKQVRKAPVNIQ